MPELPLYTRPPFEIDINVELPFPEDDAEALEVHADEVLAVLAEHASCALGSAVSGNFDERKITLAFSVSAMVASEVHRDLAHVAEVLEEHGLYRGPGASQTSSPEPVAPGEPVCA